VVQILSLSKENENGGGRVELELMALRKNANHILVMCVNFTFVI
jgi:hypothetical protein